MEPQNIYGMSKNEFRQLKERFNALPEGKEKEAIRKQEAQAIKAIENEFKKMGFEENENGGLSFEMGVKQ